jgi:glycerate-2-kinase
VETEIQGEARTIGRHLVREAHEEKTCLLYGGETTVTVVGKGKGGRNQELALGGLTDMREGVILIAAASDGWDNSDVAGALVDSSVKQKAAALSMSPEYFLKDNNAYEFFKRTGSHIKTGRTGSNVSDLYMTVTSWDKGDRIL